MGWFSVFREIFQRSGLPGNFTRLLLNVKEGRAIQKLKTTSLPCSRIQWNNSNIPEFLIHIDEFSLWISKWYVGWGVAVTKPVDKFASSSFLKLFKVFKTVLLASYSSPPSSFWKSRYIHEKYQTSSTLEMLSCLGRSRPQYVDRPQARGRINYN